MEGKAELPRNPEVKFQYGAIIIPSYGMSRDSKGYHLTFFSGIACRAAYELWKDGLASKVIIEGAKIFPKDSMNDGDLMHNLLLKLGVAESAIVQRRDNSNTYNQLLDARKTIREQKIPGKVLIVHSDLHDPRVPILADNYQINSDKKIAEEVMSDKYPAFRKVWDEIKSDPSYKEKMKDVEALMVKALKIDPQGHLARLASWASFPFKGADVPDIRGRKTVRYLATSKAH